MLVDLVYAISLGQCIIGIIIFTTINPIFQRPLSPSAESLRRIRGADRASEIQLRVNIFSQSLKRNANSILLFFFPFARCFRLIPAAWGLVFDPSEKTLIDPSRDRRSAPLGYLDKAMVSQDSIEFLIVNADN
jgi:hypothetical protein